MCAARGPARRVVARARVACAARARCGVCSARPWGGVYCARFGVTGAARARVVCCRESPLVEEGSPLVEELETNLPWTRFLRSSTTYLAYQYAHVRAAR